MEFWVEFAQLIGERIVDATARAPKTSASEKRFKELVYFLQKTLTILILATSIVLPADFFYSSYREGNLKATYFYIGIAFVIIAFVSSLFTVTKFFKLFDQKRRNTVIHETTTIEDDIRHEVGIEVLLALLSAIPVINLGILSLIVDRVLNVFEITANNPKRQKIREVAESIAFGALLVFLVSSLVFSILLTILGDTRNPA